MEVDVRKSVQLGLVAAICAAALAGVPAPERAYGARIATTVRIGANRTVARVYRPVVLQGKLQTASGRALGGTDLAVGGPSVNGDRLVARRSCEDELCRQGGSEGPAAEDNLLPIPLPRQQQVPTRLQPGEEDRRPPLRDQVLRAFRGFTREHRHVDPQYAVGQPHAGPVDGVLAGCPRGRRRSARDHGDEAAAHRGRSQPLSVRRRFCAWQRSVRLQVRLHRDSGQDTQRHGPVARRVATAQGSRRKPPRWT